VGERRSTIGYLLSYVGVLSEADEEFEEGNLDRAAEVLDQIADHWNPLRQTMPGMFDDKCESGMVGGKLLIRALSQPSEAEPRNDNTDAPACCTEDYTPGVCGSYRQQQSPYLGPSRTHVDHRRLW